MKTNTNKRDAFRLMESLEARQMFSGAEPPDGIDPDGYELNNTFATASNLGTTDNFSTDGLTINLNTDVDYFKFVAPSNETIGVNINFVHSRGNLRLDVYNASQTLIGSSNSSTITNGNENVAIAASAGQTYFVRVEGATATATSDDYSLTIGQLSANFTWNMPKRFGNQLDQWGLPMVQNTQAYAYPNPIWINNTQYASFGVHLDGSSSFLGSSGVTYDWQISGLLTQHFTASTPILDTNLPEGQYNVTLTASASGVPTQQITKSINVVDHLIVAIGDSYGSGEGNPNNPTQYDFFGFPTSGAKWAQSSDDFATAANRRAHRSSYAGVVQAAKNLENADPYSAVTLVFLDHTGALIPNLIDTPQGSGDINESGTDADQITQMLALIGNRRVDSLFVSIGGNDAGFVDTGGKLVQYDPEKDGSFLYNQELSQLWTDANAKLATLPGLYDQLANRLAPLNVGQVFLLEYPDPTHPGGPQPPPAILGDIADGYELDGNELTLVRNNVVQKLGRAMVVAAHKHQWTYVTDIASAFGQHGYGDWFRTASESVVMQGPVWNKNTPSADEKAHTTGMLHPSNGGLDLYRDRIQTVFGQPDLVTTSFWLSSNAFLPGAIDGYTVTIKNLGSVGTAGASVARLYLSRDTTFDASDSAVLDINVPAIAPGQQVTLSGVLPVISDPVHDEFNLDYAGVVLDVNNQVAEGDEFNFPFGNNDIATIRPDRDLTPTPGVGMVISGPQISLGQTINGKLGLDEFIGGGDMDIYTFTVDSNQRVVFDIDNPAANPNYDTYLRIYPVWGGVPQTLFSPLVENDNARAPGEPSANNGESYLSFQTQFAGTYCLVVSHALNGQIDPLNFPARINAPQGQYALSMSLGDSTPPALNSSAFEYNVSKQRAKFAFSENVAASLNASSLLLKNLSTNQTVPSGSVAMAYDAGTNTATFTFPGFSNGVLPDGNYHAVIPAGTVKDASGNTLGTDITLDFFTLGGDANRDRHVDVTDLGILASNWQASGRSFSQGDFNYDGRVDVSDLGVLATKWQSNLPAATATFAKSTTSERLASQSIAADVL